MSYVRRSYLPSSLHHRTYGPTPRYGSGYQRVYGHAQPAEALAVPQPQVVEIVSPQSAPRLAEAA